MQIISTAHMSADPDTAWRAFHDERILAKTIPGVESLTPAGEGAYDVVLTMGVAAIKGTYKGTVSFSQEEPTSAFVLSAKGSGGPGTIGADIAVWLATAPDGGTDIDWTADAILGGAIGGVGQRMLSGVAKRIAAKFFTDIDAAIQAGPEAAAAEPQPDAASPAPIGSPAAEQSRGRAAPAPVLPVHAPGRGVGDFAVCAAVGAGAALLGVCIGLLAGRR